MRKYNWNRLSHLQISRYAEYFVKMEFTLFGFEVYTAEVDDRGVDFVIRKDETDTTMFKSTASPCWLRSGDLQALFWRNGNFLLSQS